jgi:hypothetical protein
MSDMCLLRMIQMLPPDVHDWLLPPERVIMLLMVCQLLRSIIKREGVGDMLRFQVTVRPKDRYLGGAGFLGQLRKLDCLCVTDLQLQRKAMRGCFYNITLILTALPRLRSLNMSDNALYTEDIWRTVDQVLRLNTSLPKQSIGRNTEFGNLEGYIQDLCTRLTALDVSRMRLENNTIRNMARVLPIASLKTLDLNGNFVDVSKTHLIVEALEGNTTLTKLNIGNNYFCHVSAVAFAEVLARNTTITDLGISIIHGFRTRTVLDGITRANTTIEILDISKQLFTDDESSECLLALLRGETPLSVLNLTGCRMLPWKVEALADIVSQHYSTLTDLKLDGNIVSSKNCMSALCNCVRTNTRLVALVLDEWNMW